MLNRKTTLQLLNCLLSLLEASHALPVTAEHHLHQRYYALLVLQNRRKALVEQASEFKELLRVDPA